MNTHVLATIMVAPLLGLAFGAVAGGVRWILGNTIGRLH